MIMDEEISKLKTKVMQVGLTKLSVLGLRLASPTTALERVATLLLWLQPHLTTRGSIPRQEACDTLPDVGVVKG